METDTVYFGSWKDVQDADYDWSEEADGSELELTEGARRQFESAALAGRSTGWPRSAAVGAGGCQVALPPRPMRAGACPSPTRRRRREHAQKHTEMIDRRTENGQLAECEQQLAKLRYRSYDGAYV